MENYQSFKSANWQQWMREGQIRVTLCCIQPEKTLFTLALSKKKAILISFQRQYYILKTETNLINRSKKTVKKMLQM